MKKVPLISNGSFGIALAIVGLSVLFSNHANAQTPRMFSFAIGSSFPKEISDLQGPLFSGTNLKSQFLVLDSNVKSLLSSDRISVYPQPAFKTLYVKLLSNAITDVRILLSTVHGKELLNASARVGKGETIVTINTETITPGTYLLTVHAGETKHEQEVVFESSDASK